MNRDALLNRIQEVVDGQTRELAKLPRGAELNTQEQLLHDTVGDMVIIAHSLEMSGTHPERLAQTQALAKRGLMRLANQMGAFLADHADTYEAQTGETLGENGMVALAVKSVRVPETCSAEQMDNIKNLSPVAAFCLNAATLLHQTQAYADQQLGASRSQGRA